jgi:hypothetical protein
LLFRQKAKGLQLNSSENNFVDFKKSLLSPYEKQKMLLILTHHHHRATCFQASVA